MHLTDCLGLSTTWGPVCDDYFDYNDHQVEVVCRQLGFLDVHGAQTNAGHTCWMRDGTECGQDSTSMNQYA